MLQPKLGFIRKPPRAALRIARGVALLIGIAVCLTTTAHAPDVKDITPKEYLRSQLTLKNYRCASALIGKESAWNHKADNGSGHYGYIQLANTRYKNLDEYDQLDWANRYTAHRYGLTKHGQPNWCKSYKHWKRYSWQ
jgi:hypothetical protein